MLSVLFFAYFSTKNRVKHKFCATKISDIKTKIKLFGIISLIFDTNELGPLPESVLCIKMKVSLVVLALMVGANASVNHQTQPQGGNDQISNILVRFDGFSGFSQDDTPLYPPLTQPEP